MSAQDLDEVASILDKLERLDLRQLDEAGLGRMWRLLDNLKRVTARDERFKDLRERMARLQRGVVDEVKVL